jgi:hypothetical protein
MSGPDTLADRPARDADNGGGEGILEFVRAGNLND